MCQVPGLCLCPCPHTFAHHPVWNQIFLPGKLLARSQGGEQSLRSHPSLDLKLGEGNCCFPLVLVLMEPGDSACPQCQPANSPTTPSLVPVGPTQHPPAHNPPAQNLCARLSPALAPVMDLQRGRKGL